MKNKIIHYKNGATLIYRHVPHAKFSSVAISFNFDKEKYPNPVPHFCEHMLFNETQKSGHNKLADRQTKIAPKLNASTSLNSITMMFKRSNKLMDECFDLSSEMLLTPKFSEKYIESEKGVIKNELLRSLNSQQEAIECTIKKTLFKNTPHRHLQILGTQQEIDAVTALDLQKFHDEAFVSQNMTIAVSGGISLRKAKKLAEKHFVSRAKSRPSTPKHEKFEKNKKGNLTIEHSTQGKTTFCNIRVKFENKATIAQTQVLARSLSGKIGSDIFNSIRNAGLSYDPHTDWAIGPQNSQIDITFTTSANNVNKILDIISQKVMLLKQKILPQELIDDAVENHKFSLDEKLDLDYINAQSLIKCNQQFKDDMFDVLDIKKQIKEEEKLTGKDLQSFAEEVFSNPENIYVTIVTDNDKENFYSYKQVQDLLTKGKVTDQSIKEPNRKEQNLIDQRESLKSYEKKHNEKIKEL